jgi:DNA-binding transcriptional regulator GbsR (MarR family)
MRRIVTLALVFLLMLKIGGGFGLLRSVQAQAQSRDERPIDPTVEAMRKKAEKQRNEQRQSSLKKDTDELFKLAGELKKSVDSSNEHVLSLEVIRKTEEIEKLAKNIRTKMKAEGYGSTLQ